MFDPTRTILLNPITSLISLAVASISVIPFVPTPGLSACITCLLYLYLKQEHRFNSTLVRRTPPSPEIPLPSREQWTANGGLKKLPTPEPDACSDDEICIVCRESPKDPTQITLCGHIFCTECLNAWHAQGETSCPQCTVSLWRDVPTDRSRLENLVKITVAEGLVAGPLTLLALCIYCAYFFLGPGARVGVAQVLLLVGLVLLSSVVLLFLCQGLMFGLEQRREQGVKWWGGDLDSGMDEALRMSLHMISIVAGIWLLAMSLTIEAHRETVMPLLGVRILSGER